MEVRFALPQRSPSPFSVPWICRAPARTAASVFATAFSVSLCAWMPTWLARDMAHHLGDDVLDLVRQRAAVRVAEHHPARARVIGCFRAGKRIGRIGFVAVEEMFAIDERLAPPGIGSLRPTRRWHRGSPRR